MSAIGSLSPTAWRGQIQGEKPPVELVTRAGVAGTGMLVGAATSTPFQIETDLIGTIAQADTFRNTALGYVGTSQSVTDGWGAVWSDVAILDFQFQYIRAASLGGTNVVILRATWTMAAEV